MNKINLKEWKCANTYDTNYGLPPQSSGIYLFLTLSYTRRYRELIYIGQSSNLYKRFVNHVKLDELCLLYDHIQFYWFATSDHIDLEKKLIKKYKPKFNIQHNG